MSKPSLVIATTEAYARGGVQTYSRRVAEILSEYARGRGCGLHCLSLLDTVWSPKQHAHPVEYESFTGAAGNRWVFARRAAAVAWRARPAATVVMHANLAPVAMGLRAAGIGGPYILVLHGIEAWRRASAAVRGAARAARWIVATTKYTAAAFGDSNRIPADRLRVIPLSVPESEVEGEAPAGSGRALRVLAAGRLASSDAYKGFDCLVDAVHRARTLGADVRLGIVGNGDDRPRLEARAAALGLNGAVRFAGSVCDKAYRDELRACDVFALPSRGEGFGLVYIEAMREGRPCIAGNHGGPPEVITDGEDGFLVEHGDVDRLASRLVTLYEHPELRWAMGRNALRKVESRYLFPRMRASWFELLDRTAN